MSSNDAMRIRLTGLRPLPAEWVLLVFLAFAFARLLTAGELRVNQGHVPRADLVIVFLGVLCVRLFVQYRRNPWPEVTRSQRQLHVVFLFLLLGLTPTVFPPFPTLHPQGGATWEGAASDLFIALYAWTEIVLLVVLPILLFWLASAQHIKEHGRLDSIGMLKAGWRPALRTLREWVPIIALIYAYGLMNPIIGHGFFGDQDAALARIDRAMFLGHDPRVLCEALVSRPLSEWLSACYVFYLPLFPLVLGAIFARRELSSFREVGFAITFVLAFGYIFYTIVPAQGPLFMDHFTVNLDAYFGAHLRAQLMDRTRVPRDCFPSLHTAGSFTLLWGAYRHARRLFWTLVPFVVSIPFACVYLRYHYVIDIFAGLALFGLVTTLTVRSRTLQAAFHSGSLVSSSEPLR